MTSSEIIESNQHYVSVWKIFSGEIPNADLTDYPGLSACWADSLFPFWNALFLTEELDNAERFQKRIALAASIMRNKKQEGLLYICEDYLSGTASTSCTDILKQEKLEFALPIIGMVGNISRIKTVQSSSLEIKRANTAAQLQDFVDANSRSYGFPLEVGRAGIEGSTFWKETAFTYVGYSNKQPVSAAAVVVNQGLLYLALVATCPSAQGRGFAKATVSHALLEAHKITGLEQTLLHATDAGFPVYKSLGYQKTTRFLTYKPIKEPS